MYKEYTSRAEEAASLLARLIRPSSPYVNDTVLYRLQQTAYFLGR